MKKYSLLHSTREKNSPLNQRCGNERIPIIIMIRYEALSFQDHKNSKHQKNENNYSSMIQRRYCSCCLVVIFVAVVTLWLSTAEESSSLRLVATKEKNVTATYNLRNTTNNESFILNQVVHREEIKASDLPDLYLFIDDPDRMCLELLKRANGTEEGNEPWKRTGGLLWTCFPCQEQAISVLGNHLSRWYMARAVAAGASVSIQIDCTSPVTDLIRQHWEPWDTQLVDAASFSWKATCQRNGLKYPHGDFPQGGGLDQMVEAIRLDLRNMTDYFISNTNYAWFSQDLDEATIHLRIGDIGRQDHRLYGMIPFHVYKKRIPKAVKSIGIVTAPFQQNRPAWGYGDADLNEGVTIAVHDYLKREFPDARVTIRNDDVNETMAMTYARMIAANWSFCGSSTFCLYPALATRGESYILKSPLFGGTPSWIMKVEELYHNVHYIEEELIFSSEIWTWNVSDIVKRLQRDA
jgi:hypothetical protein